MIDLNDKVVNDLLQEWKERLGLQDWAIAVRYNCKIEDMELEGAGETDWNNINKCGTIKIISKEEYGSDRILDYDFERILVHELLHCKFGVIDITDRTYESHVADELRHQLIDDLARALVMAKRGETKRKLAKNCKEVKDINEPKKEIEITPFGSVTKEIISE